SSRQEYRSKQETASNRVKIWPIVQESLRGPALSAMLLGITLGLLARPESVYESFFDPLFRGLLSVLMLVMGMEAWSRIGELRKVAQWYVVYSVVAPFVHGFIAFGLGLIAHYATGFSLGGVVILAVIAASSSDISGPPTLRAGIPSANPSAYIGSSTAIGTPIAIGLCIPLFLGLAQAIGGG
ncbi:MAG: sodium-dependent bicarbonate transport family permease, partial [Microcoleus sp. SIO2G3]|nr:sodium-dependent bicarbonate transport family permease [Microcoleus sp. SIO2G3]